MVDLSKNRRIFLRPGYTDMRLGVIGLSKLIGKPETGCAYAFCGAKGRTVKIIEYEGQSIWLHIKKAPYGVKFSWPDTGSDQEVDKDTLMLLLDSIDAVARLRSGGKNRETIVY
jgi:hypothetical protein